jgi:Holliday junction resolvase RusA-like endonuclease
MSTRRKVDLSNLLNSTLDILVHYGVLIDDNRNIVYSVDGSRVFYDKENPRTEIEITRIEEDFQTWAKE